MAAIALTSIVVTVARPPQRRMFSLVDIKDPTVYSRDVFPPEFYTCQCCDVSKGQQSPPPRREQSSAIVVTV